MQAGPRHNPSFPFRSKSLAELAKDQMLDGQMLASWRESHAIPNAISAEIYRFMRMCYPEFQPAGFGQDHRVFVREGGQVVVKVSYSLGNLAKEGMNLARIAFGNVADPALLTGPKVEEQSREFKTHRSPTVRSILSAQGISLPEYYGFLTCIVSEELIFYLGIYERVPGGTFPSAEVMLQFRAQIPDLSAQGVFLDWGTPNNVIVPMRHLSGCQTSANLFYVDSVGVDTKLWAIVDQESDATGQLEPEVFETLIKR